MTRDLVSYYNSLKGRLSKKKILEKLKFATSKEFADWYNMKYQEQNGKCHYCKINAEVIYALVKTGKLKSGRFYEEGIKKQGKGRGIHFEVDRKIHNGNYEPDNCVLACYFCNNDKSDIFSEAQYFEFLKDRVGYLNKLLITNENTQTVPPE
jgi:hypothetical protein